MEKVWECDVNISHQDKNGGGEEFISAVQFVQWGGAFI